MIETENIEKKSAEVKLEKKMKIKYRKQKINVIIEGGREMEKGKMGNTR